MAVYEPSARTSSAVYMARTRPHTQDVYTAVYGPCTRPCTRHVYGRVHVSTSLRVTACYTAVYGPSTRPKTAVYTAANGRVTCRVYGRVQAVSAHVHGSVRAVCTAVFGRVHWPCTLPFSAVYVARTRPCNGPCNRPLHCRVQGPSVPCMRHVGLMGSTLRPCAARYGVRSVYTAMYTAHVDEHVHGCVWDVYTTVHMTCYGRVHGPRP